MCVHHVHARGPWRSEKGVVSLDLGLRWVVMSRHVGAWAEPGPLQGQPVHFLTAEPSPQPLHSFLISVFFCLICLLLVLFLLPAGVSIHKLRFSYTVVPLSVGGGLLEPHGAFM